LSGDRLGETSAAIRTRVQAARDKQRERFSKLDSKHPIFCNAEIGMNKAATLAHRYGLAWGIPINVVEEPFASKHGALSASLGNFYRWDRNVIFVTCVDRNTARQEVAKVCKTYPAWWIDTGNLKTSGQVSVGRELFEKEPSPLRLPSVTT
jgi:hypothetical protein